jgi:hypothetical protein
MALPEQIRKQTEAVQELYKELNSEGSGEATPPTDVTPTDANQSSQDASSSNSDSSSANPPVDSNEHSSTGDANEDYVQKYKTLQGMYNAEVPRLHSQNREMQARVAQMEQLLSTLSTQPTTAPQTVQAQRFVSDTEREEYGESLDVMRKVSREEIVPIIGKISALENALNHIAASLNTSIVPQVQQVARQQAMSAEDKFWGTLTAVVPNWQQMNNDPDFQSWLLDIDPMTGVTRQTYLEQAQANLDVARVSSFFTTFSQATGKYANANAQPTRSAPASELEKQVAPGRGRNSGTPTTQTTRSYSPDDIKNFFNDVRSGKYRGREAERDRIERDIFAAQRENRIIANA